MNNFLKLSRLNLISTMSALMMLSVEASARDCDIDYAPKYAASHFNNSRCKNWPFQKGDSVECIDCINNELRAACDQLQSVLTDKLLNEALTRCVALGG